MKTVTKTVETKKPNNEIIWELKREVARIKKLLERERARRKRVEDEFRRSIPYY